MIEFMRLLSFLTHVTRRADKIRVRVMLLTSQAVIESGWVDQNKIFDNFMFADRESGELEEATELHCAIREYAWT